MINVVRGYATRVPTPFQFLEPQGCPGNTGHSPSGSALPQYPNSSACSNSSTELLMQFLVITGKGLGPPEHLLEASLSTV